MIANYRYHVATVFGARYQLATFPSAWLWACLTATCLCAQAAAPSVIITNPPAYGSSNNLAGITRSHPEVRWISFSGYDWWVKTSTEPVGPGPNYFSDSTNNVWVDGLGQLHLRISNRSNQWQCAELVSARTFGYGSYRFKLASPADSINPNAVLGLFTWSDDGAYANREIDIECSRWGGAAEPSNAQFVVQPYDLNGHLKRFTVPADQTNATLLFTWETNRVSFQSQRGEFSPSPSLANVISNWTYTLPVPLAGGENLRLNLWLFRGTAPTDQREVEVILSSFRFVPLGAR